MHEDSLLDNNPLAMYAIDVSLMLRDFRGSANLL